MGKTIRATHATITRDTPAAPFLWMPPGDRRGIVAAVTIGDDLQLAFEGETIPARIRAIDALLGGTVLLRQQLERDGELRFEEFADHHDAAHDADCTCLTEHGVMYLVPLVGELVPDEPATETFRCEPCSGTGTMPGGATCPQCLGEGSIVMAAPADPARRALHTPERLAAREKRIGAANEAAAAELTAQDGVPRVRCDTCGGRGSSPDGDDPFAVYCLSCDGTGWVMDLSGPGFEDCATEAVTA